MAINRPERPATPHNSDGVEGTRSASTDGAQCPTGMVFIPGGTLNPTISLPTAGSHHELRTNDYINTQNQRTSRAPIEVPSFCLDQHEVSAEEYDGLTSQGQDRTASSCDPTLCFNTQGWQCSRRGSRLPANCVSLTGARRYCETRGARLPTEAEWEYTVFGPDADGTATASDPARDLLPTNGASNIDSIPRGGGIIYGLISNVGEWVDPCDQRLNERTRLCEGRPIYRHGQTIINDLSHPTLHVANRRYSLPSGETSPLVGFRCARNPAHTAQ